MRYIDFKRGNPYIFNIKDMEELYKADRFFARKVTMEVMQKLQKHLFLSYYRKSVHHFNLKK